MMTSETKGLPGVPQVYEEPSAQFREWAAGRTAEAAWDECPRGDWLLWWAGWAMRDWRPLVLATAGCVRMALPVPAGGDDAGWTLAAIEAAEEWAHAAPSSAPTEPWLTPEGLEASRLGARALWWSSNGRGGLIASAVARAAGLIAGYSNEHGAIRAGDAAAVVAFYASDEERPAIERRCADLVRSLIPFPGPVPLVRNAHQRWLSMMDRMGRSGLA